MVSCTLLVFLVHHTHPGHTCVMSSVSSVLASFHSLPPLPFYSSPALTRALLLLLLKGPSRIAKKNYSSVPSAWLHQKFIFLSFSWASTPVYYSLFVLGRFPNTFPTMTIPHSPMVLRLHPWENWGIPRVSLASLFPTSASCVWLHTLPLLRMEPHSLLSGLPYLSWHPRLITLPVL